MGSVLTDPFTTSCTPSLHPSFPSSCLDLSTSTMETIMRTMSRRPISAPTTVTRPSSSSSACSSLGSRPSAKSSFGPTDLRLVRSRAMCMMLVPRFLSTPISSAISGTLLAADLLQRWPFELDGVKATALLVEVTEWYSKLRFPIPLLAFSLERTV